MAVGLGLEAKKLRWLRKGGWEGSLSVAWPYHRLLSPASSPPESRASPLLGTLDALAAGG